MKLVAIILTVVIFSFCFFIFKKGNSKKITNDQGTTKGIVTDVFYRGKLPFCKFSYHISGKKYTKTQEVSKSNSKNALHKTFTVFYEKGNPKNAIILFNKKESLK